MTLASRLIPLAGAALSVILTSWYLPGQVVELKDGSISGKVVNSATRQPVSGVDLTLAPTGSGAKLTITSDAQGNFSLDRIKPGRYLLQASKPGYARTTYGAAAIGNPGSALTVVSDRGISGLELKLIPLATIQGKVINRKGDPVPGVTIACGFVDSYGAPPTMEPLKNATDARGEYRLSDMPPGRYYVQALPSPPASEIDAGANLPAYYPSVGKFGEAQPITVAPGQEASGINITLREAPVFHVRGKVSGSVANQSFSALDLWVLPKIEGGGPQFGQSYTQAISRRAGGSRAIRQDGTFDLKGVEPGLYELVAVSVTERGLESLGRVTLNVADRDIEDVVLQIGAFVQLSFRIQAEQDLADVSCFLSAYPLDRDSTTSTVAGTTGPDRVFTYDRAFAGKYALRARCKPEGWVVKSARLASGVGVQDVLDAGMDLTGFSGPAVVNLVLGRETGVVVATVSEDGAPTPGRWVTLIPDPPGPGGALHEVSGWSDEDGRLIVKSAAPGDYRVYAWREASLATSSDNPAFLARFAAQSAKVTVRAGQQVQVETKTVQP